jgi:6-phospho-beta-glucosidase
MKLTILGGGGFRTPWVYRALADDLAEPGVDEVVLYDIDSHRLGVVASILAQVEGARRPRPTVTVSTDLDQAVEGADFVFAAVREGGLEGRQADEHVALDLKVLGQETTGPGGLAYGLRTVPVMQQFARRIRALAPDAWVMNFTNPAGMITEAMQAILGDRVLGICDTPSGLGRRVAHLLDLPAAEVQMDYIGLNHLGWMRRIMYQGSDVLPELLADPKRTNALEEGAVFGPEWLQTLGAIPNEYLYYYYFNTDAVAAIRAAPETRGDFLARTQPAFYDAVAADPSIAFEHWRTTIADRSARYMAEAKAGKMDEVVGDPASGSEHSGYAGVALGVMRAISRNERHVMILNVRNGTTIPALPADAVIEVPTMVDGNGVHPLATATPEPYQLGLMSSVKAVERLVISAATTGSIADARNAFALHPLVGSVNTAEALLSGYRAAIPGVARLFRD